MKTLHKIYPLSLLFPCPSSQPCISNFGSKVLKVSCASHVLLSLSVPVTPSKHLQLCHLQISLLSYCHLHHDSRHHYHLHLPFYACCHPSVSNTCLHPLHAACNRFFTSLVNSFVMVDPRYPSSPPLLLAAVTPVFSHSYTFLHFLFAFLQLSWFSSVYSLLLLHIPMTSMKSPRRLVEDLICQHVHHHSKQGDSEQIPDAIPPPPGTHLHGMSHQLYPSVLLFLKTGTSILLRIW